MDNIKTIRDRELFLKHFHQPDDTGRPLADRVLRFIELKQLYLLIDLEQLGRNSPSVLRRLHSRVARLRTQRERASLLAGNREWRVNYTRTN